MNIRDNILEFMREQAYKPMNIKELSEVFDIGKADYKIFKKLLKDMEKEGLIIKNRTDHFGVPEKMGLVKGSLQETLKVLVLLYQKRIDQMYIFHLSI